jgi:RimJ/RimL family protein N-acetyltransferase
LLDLLRLEIETLWVLDARGRLLHSNEPAARPAPLAVVAAVSSDHALALAARLPDALAERLSEAFVSVPPLEDFRLQPPVIDHLIALLEPEYGHLQTAFGPTHVVPGPLAYRTEAKVYTSQSDVTPLMDLRPERDWTAGEWRDLLESKTGPFAIARLGGAVASICHTSRLAARSAEAGVWTAPAYRGRGLAPAVTAAWANLFDLGKFTLFYSTSADNQASQRVAAKLGLREIGWLWSLRGRRAQ